MYSHILLQVSPDVPDLWKTIVITLFILSMINERITNFIKLNIESILTRLLGLEGYQRLFNCRTNFRLVEDDPAQEKRREQGIVNFAVISGFFVAAFCGADLLYMFDKSGNLLEDNVLLGKPVAELLELFANHALGYLLTAFFISLGSKFWHDLLDVLLYTSNLKRKLANEPELFRSGSADEVREFAELTPEQLASAVLAQHASQLRSQPNVVDVVMGQYPVEGIVRDALSIYLLDANRASLPASLPVTLASGRRFPLPVVYVTNYGGTPKSQFRVGDSIQLTNPPSRFQGRVCCLLNGIDPRDQQPSTYALTCSHVLTNNTPDNMGGFLDEPNTFSVGIDQTAGGLWRYGFHGRSLDIALVRIQAGVIPQFSATLNLQKATRALTKADVNTLGVAIWTQTGITAARLTAILTSELNIEYGNGAKQGMVGLLELSQRRQGLILAPTQAGDSGAPVFDDNNRLVGMIVAGNTTHSYAIPINAILEKINFSFPNLSLQL